MSSHGSQSIHRALSILRCFAPERPSVTIRQICDITGLTTPTTHRMCKALEANGFLARGPGSGTFTLGPAVMDLAHVLLARSDDSDLLAASWPHLERLREVTGETVALHVRIGSMRLCLAELQSHHPMRMARGVGHTAPLHGGAAGKVLLAWLPPDQLRAAVSGAPLRRLTARTVVDGDVLEQELDVVRGRGYALSLSEVVQGAAGIAVPVFGHAGVLRAAVSITGPATRWTQEGMVAAAAEIRQVVAELGASLGPRPSSEWEAG